MLIDEAGCFYDLARVPISKLSMKKIVEHGLIAAVVHLMEQGCKIGVVLNVLRRKIEGHIAALARPGWK